MSNHSHDQLASYKVLTQQTDPSIGNNSELSALRRQIICEERERIAADLHDDLAQALTFIFTTATAARLKCDEKHITDITDQLIRIEDTAQGLLYDLRLTILGLKVAEKLELGLGASIKNFSLRFSLLARIPINLEIDPQLHKIHLDSHTELQLFRIVQESLVNIQKHSNASNIRIRARVLDNGIHFSIIDNGRGFDTKILENNNFLHFGISSMEERANSIGASFRIRSQLGEGTQIQVTLPNRSR